MANPAVFGIGVPKSGGHSLSAALSQLGMSVVHLGHDEWAGGSLKRLFETNAGTNQPLCNGFPACDGVVDSPVWQNVPALSRQYPAAKFILTYRPPHECALSWVRMLHKRSKAIPPEWNRSYKTFLDAAVYHVDAMTEMFLQDRERLLILDMADPPQYKWNQLASFLGVAMPANPEAFPHEFSHRTY